LGIYVVAPLTPWLLVKLSYALARGKWKQLPEVVNHETRNVTVRFPRRKAGALAVIDGELIKLASRVDLRIHPGALKVVVPKVAGAAKAEPAEQLSA
jgi:diacylglycerol kinase family enzyme